MSEGARIGSAIVVGTGTVGLAAAIALRRALPDAAITLLQLPDDPDGWIDRLGAASPAIHKFHRQIGLDPRQFVQRTRAEPVHLRRYRREGGGEAREASTATIQFVEGVPLHHIWLRHRETTGEGPPDFAAMLLAIREARGDEGGFGARYDPVAYRALLADMAATLGIALHESMDVRVEVKDGAIGHLATAAGDTLTADLYVDAAAPRSRLLAALGVGWCDWSPWLPSMALAVTAGMEGPFGEETLDWMDDTIVWQTRRWSACIAPDARAQPPGCMARFASGNVVAIGEAAARAPVADGAAFGLALDDIMRLTALLPRPGGTGRDTREYDRRTQIAYGSLADWSSLSLSSRAGDRPAGLAAKLDAFEARGRVSLRELDPIQPGEWLARLMALAPVPRRVDPTALALPEEIVGGTIARAK